MEHASSLETIDIDIAAPQTALELYKSRCMELECELAGQCARSSKQELHIAALETKLKVLTNKCFKMDNVYNRYKTEKLQVNDINIESKMTRSNLMDLQNLSGKNDEKLSPEMLLVLLKRACKQLDDARHVGYALQSRLSRRSD